MSVSDYSMAGHLLSEPRAEQHDISQPWTFINTQGRCCVRYMPSTKCALKFRETAQCTTGHVVRLKTVWSCRFAVAQKRREQLDLGNNSCATALELKEAWNLGMMSSAFVSWGLGAKSSHKHVTCSKMLFEALRNHPDEHAVMLQHSG